MTSGTQIDLTQQEADLISKALKIIQNDREFACQTDDIANILMKIQQEQNDKETEAWRKLWKS